MLKEGIKAPVFCLKGLNESDKEKEYCLKDFKGKKIILYFYPKDNTPGCTKEACNFRDQLKLIKSKNMIVLGVSPDSIQSHKKFKEKHDLNFPLLSDPEKRIAKKYHVFGEKKLYGKTVKGIIRSTFIINEKGVIEKAFYKVKVKGYVEALLNKT